MSNLIRQTPATVSLLVTSCFLVSGCGSGSNGAAGSVSPAAAATELDRTFETADASTKKNINAASEAMKRGEYEKAVVSLQNVREGGTLTMDQGIAVHRSVISMEGELISAMESGDENARRAYQSLRRMNRN